VIATQNPIESEGTYPLPEAQLDRFALRTTIGYPGRDDEVEVVERRLARATDAVELRVVSDPVRLAGVRAAVEGVHVERVLVDYVVEIVRRTRRAKDLALGASPRGSLAVVGVARARAVLRGRDFVTPDDIRDVAVPCLAHRVVASDQAWARGTTTDEIVRDVVDSVAAPSWQ
jgi:MoxR-like ATPase